MESSKSNKVMAVAKANKLVAQTKSLIQERQRCQAIGLDYSDYEKTIHSNIEALKEHQEGLKSSLNSLEADARNPEDQVRAEEDKLIKITKAIETLELLYNPVSEPVSNSSQENSNQTSLGLKDTGSVKFKPYQDTEESTIIAMEQENDSPYSHLANSQILELQQRTFEEQDRNLDFLSQSVGRQRELGVLIGDELDRHVVLLDETNDHIDATDNRLNMAQTRLRRLTHHDRRNRLCGVVVGLAVTLLVLIGVIRLFRL